MNTTRLQVAYVGALAGAAAGLVVGVGACLAARVGAYCAGIACTLTLGSALLRVLSLTAAGVILGPLFVWVSKYMRGSDLGRGLALGLSVLVVLGTSAYLFRYSFGEEIFVGTPVLCTVLYAALFPSYAIVLSLFVNPVQKRLLATT